MRPLFGAAQLGITFGRTTFPPAWNITRFAGNPVIDVDDNPLETTEQYNPGPLILANGDIWVYVKGQAHIYAWKSTDGGETFVLQNSGNAVLSPGAGGAWDNSFVVEPFVIYDELTDTIHMWYGGRDASGNAAWAWGHATAPGATPTVFTKDAANPILTSAQVSTALGGAAMADLKPDDVVVIDGEFHFFGYCLYNSVYRIIRCKGTTWNDPADAEILYTAPGGSFPVVHSPSVFRLPGYLRPKYGMLFTIGGNQFDDPRWIRAAESDDGQSWTFLGDNVLAPTGTSWEQVEVYAGAVLKETTSPYALPYRDPDGRWLYYYSGLASSHDANVGLVYMRPDS